MLSVPELELEGKKGGERGGKEGRRVIKREGEGGRKKGRTTVNLDRLQVISEYIYDASVFMMRPKVVFITSAHFC